MRVLALFVLFIYCSAQCLASETAAEAASASAPIGITLKTEALSAGEEVLLKEIATLTLVPAGKQASLESVAVGRAAQAGQNRAFSQADVLAALRKSGFISAVNVQGAASVTVTAALERIGGKKFADVAAAAVRAYFEKDPDLETEIEITSVPADVNLRPGAISLEADLPEGGARPGSQSIKVRVLQGGRRMAESVVGIKVKLSGSMQVAAEKLQSGDLLNEADIKIVRKELNANDFLGRTNAAKLVGMRAKKTVNLDEPLIRSSFAMPQVIKRGDAVTVYVRRGGLELATRGEAKTDAALDESVRVLVADSGAEVIARASGSREATLDDPTARKRN